MPLESQYRAMSLSLFRELNIFATRHPVTRNLLSWIAKRGSRTLRSRVTAQPGTSKPLLNKASDYSPPPPQTMTHKRPYLHLPADSRAQKEQVKR